MTGRIRTAGPIAFAVLLWSALAASAQTVQVVRESADVIALTGGSGAQAWKLRYGVIRSNNLEQRTWEVSNTRAYFANGSWLRLIDTERGAVLGRWRFPYQILEVAADPTGGPAVRVRFKLSPAAGEADRVVSFDPTIGAVPKWDLGALLWYRIAETEAAGLLPGSGIAFNRWDDRSEEAASLVPAFENMIKRDPTAPWLRLALGKLLGDAGDARADAVLSDAVGTASDFSELFPMSARLGLMGKPELAAAAYDRAYTDFLVRGRDPRLMTFLISRIVLYSPLGQNPGGASDAYRRQSLERMYLLAPGIEGAERAWAGYAAYLERGGDAEGSRVWSGRAHIARRESLYPPGLDTQLVHDRFFLIALGSVLAAVLLIGALYVKYAAERRMRVLAAARMPHVSSTTFLNVEYWSRRERASLLVIASAGWLSIGPAALHLQVLEQASSDPIHVGEIGGPDDITSIRNRMPPSAERDLLLAIAYHSTGELAEAERAYRALPQFAESWNNLGVILAGSGRAAEARLAFAHALEILPGLPEAALNTGGAPQNLATEMHRKYVPEMMMLALPGREHFLRAAMGPMWTERHWRSLLGPLPELRDLQRGVSGPALLARVSRRPFNAFWMPTGLVGLALLAALGLALALWAFIPFRDVTIPLGRVARVLEFVLPGVSPSWRWVGGLVLLISSVLVLMLSLHLATGSPYLLTRLLQPQLVRAFGLPPDVNVGMDDVNPPVVATAGALGFIFLANSILVRRGRAQ
jgi:tetratricopeptide (TPR) repeat protein